MSNLQNRRMAVDYKVSIGDAVKYECESYLVTDTDFADEGQLIVTLGEQVHDGDLKEMGVDFYDLVRMSPVKTAENRAIEEALKNGVRDNSYSTVRHGTVHSYSGTAFVIIGGKYMVCIGQGPKGRAEYVSKDGGIDVCHISDMDSSVFIELYAKKAVKDLCEKESFPAYVSSDSEYSRRMVATAEKARVEAKAIYEREIA